MGFDKCACHSLVLPRRAGAVRLSYGGGLRRVLEMDPGCANLICDQPDGTLANRASSSQTEEVFDPFSV